MIECRHICLTVTNENRQDLILRAFMTHDSGTEVALSALVKRLQEALGRAEEFDVVTALPSGGGEPVYRCSADCLQMTDTSFHCRLAAEPGHDARSTTQDPTHRRRELRYSKVGHQRGRLHPRNRYLPSVQRLPPTENQLSYRCDRACQSVGISASRSNRCKSALRCAGGIRCGHRYAGIRAGGCNSCTHWRPCLSRGQRIFVDANCIQHQTHPTISTAAGAQTKLASQR